MSFQNQPGVLDSDRDPAYDDLASVASTVLDAPIAMIVFVDENRLWLKAHVSQRADGMQGIQSLSRMHSFCSYTITEDDALVVEDARADARFVSHPWVQDEPKLRFYAGTAIRGPRGGKLGTLCVLDDRVRKVSEAQLAALRALARQASVLIDRDRRQRAPDSERESVRRLASIGQIAGGIAHEIKNPLSVILAQSQVAAELARLGKLAPDQLLRSLESITSVTLRIHHIVKGMEGLAHSSPEGSREVVLVRSLVDDALGFCSPKLAQARIGFKAHVQGELRLRCHAVQVSQVLVVLISNVIDAVKELGDGSREVALYVESVQSAGPLIRFSVVDSGGGVPQEVRPRLFEPLFTTKRHGCGFGLSISRQIAEAHGGRVFLDETAQRTTFVLDLPGSI